MDAYRDLTESGVTTRSAATLTGVARATATRKNTPRDDVAREPVAPANRLTDAERAAVLATLNSDEFVDQAPLQVYAGLLARGQYLCSVSTMYRVLAEHDQVKERRRLAKHPARAVPELVATGPGQVYTWDITKLPGPVKGCYYDAYVMIDIYSRYIVGAHVHAHESGLLAEEMMKEIFGVHGIPSVVHADRGTSMTSKTVAALLADLNVTRSHSRPRVSNDNPYSEALFKTLKYLPVFPDRFGSLAHAREFIDTFATAYNHEHHHTGIGLHTPADVHYGHARTVAADRSTALAAARAAHPERFGTTHNPKILALPDSAWINQPAENPAA
jgi:transposase InsO family protein